ncbi:hypothetical protein [uncultured Thermomonospora sp.]|mgnify:CR=1 FL=1|jgi:Prolyl-tRNA synthetase|uniref:hypothetical protein n=1 Tax=uncultured Thermomonospora sp. TaxID=671175 RepID=UPI00259BE3C4|nr:hypothetical protein [uncultured Thermomonospora sp.]
MSRHTIPNPPGTPDGREITVGWDRPLETFFAMAFDRPPADDPDGDDIEVFWHGTTRGEITTIDDLRALLDRHGITLPDHIADQLEQDRRAEGNGWAGRPAALLFGSLMGGNA